MRFTSAVTAPVPLHTIIFLPSDLDEHPVFDCAAGCMVVDDHGCIVLHITSDVVGASTNYRTAWLIGHPIRLVAAALPDARDLDPTEVVSLLFDPSGDTSEMQLQLAAAERAWVKYMEED